MIKYIHKLGAGKDRDYWGIRRWMYERGITNAQIARDINRDATLVSMTIRGVRNSRLVLGRLRELGCPEDSLSLPSSMVDNSACS